MNLSLETLNQLATETGFRVEFLEKVNRLLGVLQAEPPGYRGGYLV